MTHYILVILEDIHIVRKIGKPIYATVQGVPRMLVQVSSWVYTSRQKISYMHISGTE